MWEVLANSQERGLTREEGCGDGRACDMEMYAADGTVVCLSMPMLLKGSKTRKSSKRSAA